jgi:ABC-type nitrate/sulfonate/bicarbonate transport system substrate-binding protein
LLGLDVDITVINDEEESLQKFIRGDITAMAMSVNRWAYAHGKLLDAGIPARMVLVTARSGGMDGIVTRYNIPGIEGLAGQKIAVPKYTAAHIMTEWLLRTSSLTEEQIEDIHKDMIYTNSVGETYEKLANDQATVAVLWEPYITQANNSLRASSLFTTNATNLIVYGIVFREDYLNAYPNKVEKFIEGTLRASNEYLYEVRYIQELDNYADVTDAGVIAMTALVPPVNFIYNKLLFEGIIQTLYEQMADVWQDLGEGSKRHSPQDSLQYAFDNSYLLNVASKFPNETLSMLDSRDNTGPSANTEALLKKTLTINFEPNVAIIREESYADLDDFARVAQILNGALIQVEGNIADTGVGDTSTGRLLSEQRAKAVCDYLISVGIDESRLVYIGNGISNTVPGLDPRSAAGMEANRRTDIFFMIIE